VSEFGENMALVFGEHRPIKNGISDHFLQKKTFLLKLHISSRLRSDGAI